MIAPLPEVGHIGHAIVIAGGTLIVDAPLTTSAVADAVRSLPPVVGVLDTEIATWRISGSALAAAHLGVPHWFVGDGSVAGAARFETALPTGAAVEEVAGRTVATLNGDVVLIGSLDRHGPRNMLDALATARGPKARWVGSGGIHEDLEGLSLSEPSPLNREAVVLTNRGEVDMHWADPRFGADAPSVQPSYVEQRQGTPWAPTVLHLGDGEPGDGRLIAAPERLASIVPTLMGERELVVTADDPALARQAAGFLARLGLAPVSWVA